MVGSCRPSRRILPRRSAGRSPGSIHPPPEIQHRSGDRRTGFCDIKLSIADQSKILIYGLTAPNYENLTDLPEVTLVDTEVTDVPPPLPPPEPGTEDQPADPVPVEPLDPVGPVPKFRPLKFFSFTDVPGVLAGEIRSLTRRGASDARVIVYISDGDLVSGHGWVIEADRTLYRGIRADDLIVDGAATSINRPSLDAAARIGGALNLETVSFHARLSR